jgi:DNA-binding transcriptional ArsR family regulator/uncharacterized protein YndB with AHSA1/START domain
MDAVFKALADPVRRQLLDRLQARNGQTLRELCDGLGLARQSVTKHLDVLEAANLVITEKRGREKLHYLNAEPINELADRWIGRYHRQRAQALADLKRALEGPAMHPFVHVSYIRTTPQVLWQALTDPAFTLQYWGAGLRSDWKEGSPVLWQMGPGAPFRDLGSVVLESAPFRRLSYSWHSYQPEHATLFGWSPEQLAELQREPRSRVTFELEPTGSSVRLTVRHEGFEQDTEMLQACSGRKPQTGGWPEVLSQLKTLLETGALLEIEQAAASMSP